MDDKPVRVERSQKRVRVLLGGEVVADTIRPLLVWEIPYYPMYYIPVIANGYQLGDDRFDVVTARATAPGAARRYPDSPVEELRAAIRLDWDAMDEWLEEDEPVYVHPRSPYARVDVLASSRHVRVELDGVTLADSRSPRILFETGLPPRYYLPMTDVRLDLLRPSDRQTRCPYKGTAGYFSVQVGERLHEDLVWIYRTPLPESRKIAGLVCFYTERVDLFVDGVLQPR